MPQTIASLAIFLLFVLLSCASEGSEFILEASLLKIEPHYTSNVSLTCSTNDSSSSIGGMDKVLMIHLVKHNLSSWEEIVRFKQEGFHAHNTSDGLLVSGFIGSPTKSFLQVTWMAPTNQVAGKYRCDVVALTMTQDFKSYHSNLVQLDIQEPLTLSRLRDLMEESDDELKKKINALKAEFTHLVSSTVSNLRKDINDSFETCNEEFNYLLNSTVISMDEKMDKGFQKQKNEFQKSVNSTVEYIMAKFESFCHTNRSGCEDCDTTNETSSNGLKEAIERITRLEKTVELIENNQHAFMKKTEDRILNIANNFEIFENRTDAVLAKQKTGVDEIVSAVQYLIEITGSQWPDGSFGLLQPDTGCPDDLSTVWKSGYMRHHTESSRGSHSSISASSHLKRPVIESENSNNYFTQSFCVTDGKEKSHVWSLPVRPQWPPGSYCIHALYDGTSACPAGFLAASIHFEDENTNNTDNHGGFLPYGYYGSGQASYTSIYYCCRSDGPTDKAIRLPTVKPFYLYRYKGQCQEVFGAFVRSEYMLIDTQCCSSRADHGKPDGTIGTNGVRIELCYYSRM